MIYVVHRKSFQKKIPFPEPPLPIPFSPLLHLSDLFLMAAARKPSLLQRHLPRSDIEPVTPRFTICIEELFLMYM